MPVPGSVHAAAQAVRARGARWARGLAAFALPQRCPGCGAPAGAALLCDACFARIPRLSFGLCARCLAASRDGVGCLAHPGFEVRAAWVYDERAAAIAHALKFAERDGLAPALAAELARVAPPGRIDAVIALPLHPARRRERGYNQAACLAAALAPCVAAPLLESALRRVRATAPQTGLGAAQRRRNLRGAFQVLNPRALAGRRVLLVDDVITTGATLEAALAALADAGARAAAVTLAWAQ